MNATRIHIFDTTLRDGEQSPGCSMNLEEKLRIARQLELLGVDVIEAGFPVASEDDFQAVQRDVVCLDTQNGTTSARSTSTASVRMASDAPPRSREIMPWSLSSS